MIVLTQQSGGTHTAQIRSEIASGFKVLYRGSSTESEGSAARSVVRKYYGEKAASTVERVPTEDIRKHVPTSSKRKRCNPCLVWTFNPNAR